MQQNDQQEPEQNRTPNNNSMAYASPTDRYGSQIQTLTTPDEDIHKFELYLRRLIKDDEGNYIQISKQMLNEQGINDVLMCMKSVLNSMTPLSNLEDWEISVLMRTLCYDLVDLFTFKSKEYDINDIDRKVITGASLRFCYIFLKRPYQEGDRKFFTKITQEVKHTTQEIGGKNKGGLSLNPLNWMKH